MCFGASLCVFKVVNACMFFCVNVCFCMVYVCFNVLYVHSVHELF